ncbi:uncharacterized protein LOC143040575 isoform X1 [Oratosquilla oratoria]|uniref:uncharacterized protein LOC143040575 isoform X1 n=1 Tax=Oratosquilla oratoria TaxID=337810 RepID=UPI003F76B9E2
MPSNCLSPQQTTTTMLERQDDGGECGINSRGAFGAWQTMSRPRGPRKQQLFWRRRLDHQSSRVTQEDETRAPEESRMQMWTATPPSLRKGEPLDKKDPSYLYPPGPLLSYPYPHSPPPPYRHPKNRTYFPHQYKLLKSSPAYLHHTLNDFPPYMHHTMNKPPPPYPHSSPHQSSDLSQILSIQCPFKSAPPSYPSQNSSDEHLYPPKTPPPSYPCITSCKDTLSSTVSSSSASSPRSLSPPPSPSQSLLPRVETPQELQLFQQDPTHLHSQQGNLSLGTEVGEDTTLSIPSEETDSYSDFNIIEQSDVHIQIPLEPVAPKRYTDIEFKLKVK